jgi:hypothetical protein
MDVAGIRQLEPKSIQFLDYFSGRFGLKDTRTHPGVYVRGRFSDLPEKSIEPIGTDADVASRTLQKFLAQHRWPEDRVRPVNCIFNAGRRFVRMGPVPDSPEAPPWLSRPARSTGRLSSRISAARD